MGSLPFTSKERLNHFRVDWRRGGGSTDDYYVKPLKTSNVDEDLLSQVNNKDAKITIGTTLPSFKKGDIIICETGSFVLTSDHSDLTKKMTRLGRGIPTGGELEFADDETISGAFDSRK